jgi:hypothetical protein
MAQQTSAMADARDSPHITVQPRGDDTYTLTCAPGSGPAPDAVQVWMDHHDDVQAARLGEARGQVQYRVEVLA